MIAKGIPSAFPSSLGGENKIVVDLFFLIRPSLIGAMLRPSLVAVAVFSGRSPRTSSFVSQATVMTTFLLHYVYPMISHPDLVRSCVGETLPGCEF